MQWWIRLYLHYRTHITCIYSSFYISIAAKPVLTSSLTLFSFISNSPPQCCQINFTIKKKHFAYITIFLKTCDHSTFSSELCYMFLTGSQGSQQYVLHPSLKLSVHSPKPSVPSKLVYTLLLHKPYISLLSSFSSHHFPCLGCILPALNVSK